MYNSILIQLSLKYLKSLLLYYFEFIVKNLFWSGVYLILVFIFTARKRSLEQGNFFSSVCQEFCSQGRGVCLSTCWYTTAPGANTPQDQAPPRTRHPHGTRHLPKTRHPSEKTPPGTRHPPGAVHAGRYGQ